MNLSALAWLIPLPPLVAFALILLFTHPWRKLSHTIALTMMSISFGLVQVLFWSGLLTGQFSAGPVASSVAWLPFRGPETWLKMGILLILSRP